LSYQFAYSCFVVEIHRFLIEEGKGGSPKMMSIGLHCRLARPGRVSGIAEFLDYVKSHKKDVWICTREQIADFWHENHYPRGGGSPMKESSTADTDGEKESTVTDLPVDTPIESKEVNLLVDFPTESGGDII
jgi:hypothetical protein